jgi:hypothetical protein
VNFLIILELFVVRLQFWIGGVIFLGMVEKAMFTSEYQNINLLGQTTQVSLSFLQIRIRFVEKNECTPTLTSQS